jgi:hypothetical protein
MGGIGVVGTRRRDTWEDYIKVRDVVLSIYEPGDVLVSGGCPKGGDRFAMIIALVLAGWKEEVILFRTHMPALKVLCEQENAPIRVYWADWKKYGKAAGILRNTPIARDSTKALVACVSQDRTGGTEDTIKKFQKFHPKAQLLLVV